jgi:hypothetical protein
VIAFEHGLRLWGELGKGREEGGREDGVREDGGMEGWKEGDTS